MVASVVPIKEGTPEPTYKASDLVTAVELAVDIGAGKMALRTHVLNADGQPALKQMLDNLTMAADWISAKYGLRNLKLQLAQEEKSLMQFRNERAGYYERCETEWSIGGRRGSFVASKPQQATLSNIDNSIVSRVQVIEKIKKDIAITEAIFKDA